MWFIGKLSRDERGIGSLVGAAFLILILMSGFAVYMPSVNVTDEYRETLGTMDQLDLKRKQEEIEFISVSTTDVDQLNITVENTGPHQTHLIWLGVSDETLNTQEYHELDVYINPAETETSIGASQPSVTITEGNKYVIQFVTELGNIVEHKFYPASEVRCELTLMALPPTVYKGNNVTVLLIVTHNDTEVDAIQSLTVSLEAEPTGLVEVKEEPSSLTVEGMRRGESAFFNWIYNTTDTGTVTFNATYNQAPTGTYALSTVEILQEPEGEEGAGMGNITITGPDPIEYNEWATYNIKVTNASGNPIPYAGIIACGDPQSEVEFQGYHNPFRNFELADANGEFELTLKGKDSDGQTITLYVTVGSLWGKKEIVQEED